MTAAPDLTFTLDLHRRIAGAPTTGFVWSPYSVASALGLAAAAARGATRDELVAVLGDPDRLAAALTDGALPDPGQPDPDVPGPAPTRLAVANTLWADRVLAVEPAYLDTVRAWPGGTARTVDFRADPDAARQEINAEVERTTAGLIRELLSPGQIDRLTRAVLVNALWLRAAWLRPCTELGDRPFRTPTGEVAVPTLHRRERTRYVRRDGWQAVGVPAGDGVVLDLLLPDDDLAVAEAALTPDTLAGLLGDDVGSQQEVDLELPRFDVTGSTSLVEPLAAAGVRTLFTADADLTALTADRPLGVSEIVHKAVLRVDAAGLEGAAATAVVITRMAFTPPAEPVLVRVDRPFLAVVRHRSSGAVYFLGRVTDPRG